LEDELHDLRVAAHVRERVVDLVRDARDERAQRGELLAAGDVATALLDARLRDLAVGHVLERPLVVERAPRRGVADDARAVAEPAERAVAGADLGRVAAQRALPCAPLAPPPALAGLR